MKELEKVFNRLKGWPWEVFKSFNPFFKVAVVILALIVWVPDPLDIIAVGFWAVIAGLFFQATTASWVVISFGILFWLVSQIVESLLVVIVTTYLIPAIVAIFAEVFEFDAIKTLFIKAPKAK